MARYSAWHPEAGAVVAEHPVTDRETPDVLTEGLDDPGELVPEDRELRLGDAGVSTDEPRVSGPETAVGPVDRGGVDAHE